MLRIGARPTDRPELRMRKETLVLTAMAITLLATLWVVIYLALGRPVSGPCRSPTRSSR